jgi:hemerythrin-like domain-containing protein
VKSLAIIRNEHQNLGAVLFSLQRLVDEIESGKQPKFEVFHGLFTYIHRFLDTYHHPKENNYLFPILKERYPDASELVAQLEQQHIEGERLFIEMLKTMSAYEFAGSTEFANFREAVYQYTTFEIEHAYKEENEILPLAEQKLKPSDWIQIDEAFCDNKDPLFAEDPEIKFSELYKTITALVPAPFGLGPAWK